MVSTKGYCKLTETRYGPAKSLITPCEVAIPIWPIIGHSHLEIINNKLCLILKHEISYISFNQYGKSQLNIFWNLKCINE